MQSISAWLFLGIIILSWKLLINVFELQFIKPALEIQPLSINEGKLNVDRKIWIEVLTIVLLTRNQTQEKQQQLKTAILSCYYHYNRTKIFLSLTRNNSNIFCLHLHTVLI